MAEPTGAAGDLWAFALKVYGGAEVSAACLELQDRYGADVPVVLTTLWMAKRGMRMDRTGMERLESQIEAWRTGMVAPLRALRRQLKSGPLPAPSDATEALRTEIKRAELHAEKIELATLAAFVEATFKPSGAGDFRGNLAVALAYYSSGADIPDTLIAPLTAMAETA